MKNKNPFLKKDFKHKGTLNMNNIELRTDLLVWLDLETTGVDRANQMRGVHEHKILEIGIHITDSNFNIIDKGFEIVIHHRKQTLEECMNDFVTKMHTDSGLLDKVINSNYNMKTAEQMMVDYIKSFGIKPGATPLCGNNVSFDKNFLDAQMPEFANLFHYRKIDVSSLKEIAVRLYPEIAEKVIKPYKHRGLDDIKESIKEFKLYQELMFKPREPEPEHHTTKKLKI